jgi:hypothetical protein
VTALCRKFKSFWRVADLSRIHQRTRGMHMT